MVCKCGFSFSKHILENGKSSLKSYAIIADKGYKRFLRAEMKVLAAEKSEKLAAIAKSARYIGILRICPECQRVTILFPDDNEYRTYRISED